jgi:hypothetical protein
MMPLHNAALRYVIALGIILLRFNDSRNTLVE